MIRILVKDTPVGTDANTVLQDLKEVRGRAHGWGVAHDIKFEISKESFAILYPPPRWVGLGDDFKLLGCLFDVRLRMDSCIDSSGF